MLEKLFNLNKLSECRVYSGYPDDTVGLLLFQLVLLFKPSRILETGFFNGYSALMMSRALSIIGEGKLISIDINDQARVMYNKYFGLNKGLENYSTLLIDDSADSKTKAKVKAGLKRQPGKYNTIDMFFIDGDHSEAGCRGDWDNYKDMLSPGALVIFHDYNQTGVKTVADEVISTGNYEYMHFPVYHNAMILRRKDYRANKQDAAVGYTAEIIYNIVNGAK